MTEHLYRPDGSHIGQYHPVTVYTPERMQELIDSLFRYFDGTENLYFETWMAQNKLWGMQVWRLKQEYKEFAEAWQICLTIQASKLLEGSTRQLDPTSKHQAKYAVNPFMARLVLACHHGYTPAQKLELSATPAPDQQPVTPEDYDRRIQELAHEKEELQKMLQEAVVAGRQITGEL